MNKIINPGTVLIDQLAAQVFCRIRITDDRLSIMGVVGPLPSGNCRGGCGQIDMEFSHEDPRDDDPRYSPTTVMHAFNKGWTKNLWWGFLRIWKHWHLNDMRVGCPHQTAMGWKYANHHNPDTFEGEACPVCGEHIGAIWHHEPLPQAVREVLEKLPSSERVPAWV